jgi:hypothetical protein
LKADLAVFGKRAVATGLKLLKFRAAERRYRVFGNQMFSKRNIAVLAVTTAFACLRDLPLL